jgi:hypothetical protein
VNSDRPPQETGVPEWAEAMRPRQAGPVRRFVRALLAYRSTQPMTVPGWNERQPPAEGTGVPARPKGPTPTLLTGAELELPRDSN